MKRSEALEIIEKTIRESSPAFPYDRALTVLGALENAGMLPPPNGKLVTNYTDMGSIPDHSWELEDVAPMETPDGE